MSQNYFLQRKKAILSKQDKSSIGKWDKKIVSLCNRINKKENYYTTSSCAGRIVLMIDQDEKAENLFLKVYHEKISFEKLKKDLEEIKSKKLIKFKSEPFIIHIACEKLEDAKELLIKSQKAGIKKAGIISAGERIIVELNGSERIEFPIINNEKILVDDNFLKLIIDKSNKNLEKSWEKIKKLEKDF